MPTLQEICRQADSLTRIQRRIFERMLRHPEAVCYATLRDMAAQMGAAEVTILHMCRRLGCSGYSELQKAFRAVNAEKLRVAYPADYTLETAGPQRIGEGLTPMADLFRQEQACLGALASGVGEQQLTDCAQALRQARTVLVYGHDASKVLVDYLVHRLRYLRIRASGFPLGDSSTVQTSLAMADERDVVVLFSFPPYYQPVTNVARYAAYRGAQVIAVTDSAASPVTAVSHRHFLCDTRTRFFFNSLTAPISLINALTTAIALEMGDAIEQVVQEELDASRRMSGEFSEEGSESKC